VSQDYYPPPSVPPSPPRQSPDMLTIGLIAAAALAGVGCLLVGAILCVIVFVAPPPAPATLVPNTVAPNVALVPTQPLATIIPTVDPANIGTFVNPYFSADLAGMTVLQIDVRDPNTGNYTRVTQLTGTDLNPFVTAMNVSAQSTAPDTACPDHVRLSITRADSSIVTLGVCLNEAVILRGGIPDLGSADLPMYGAFSDALAPYLPQEYKTLLGV
jgi:hypothetical protein